MVLRAPSGAGEQSEAIVEVVEHLLGAHRHHAGGGQLDGEGDPIEALADLGHRRGLVGSVEREPGLHGLGSLEEQLDRGRVGPGSCVEGRNGPPVLRREAQALAAGGQDPDGGGLAQDRVDEIRRRGQDVLAVVDHDEQASARQRVDDALGHRPARSGRDPEDRRHGVGHGRGIADRRQLDHPDAVGELVGQLGGDLHREPGLADPARTGEGHEPVRLHELADLLHLHLAADEARDLHRQVPGGRVQRPQRRERGLEAVRPHLVEADRRRQVPQPVLAQIDQVDPGDQRGRGVAHDDLAAVPGAHHPGGAVQGRPEVVVVTLLHLAAGDPHPHRELEPSLCRHGGLDRIAGRVEHGAHPVAGVLEHLAPVGLDDRSHQVVVHRERRSHRVRVGLPHPGGALDVGEEEGHRPHRPISHASGSHTGQECTMILMIDLSGASGRPWRDVVAKDGPSSTVKATSST